MTETTPTGYLDLVRRNRDFRFLWFGQIVSLLGDWFNLIASASLIALLTQSGVAVGGLFVVRMLAPFIVSPVAGVAADRYNRKWLLILADASRAVTVLGFLLVREPQQVWLLYTLTAIQLAISGFFFPARNAILPDIVSRRELGAANALSAATWSVMLAFGAALGGIVAGEWGIYPAFVIDALTFLLSALLIAQVTYEHAPRPDLDTSIAAALQEYLDGLRYLRRHVDYFVITLHKPAFATLVSGAFQVIQVRLAEQVFVIGEGGSTGLGLLYASVGVGTGVGPIIARRFTGDRGRALRVAIVAGYAITAAGLAIIGTLSSFGLVLLGTFLRGFGNGIGWVLSTQLLLQLLPDRVRGRVFSTEFAMFTLGNAAGAAVGGWAVDNPALDVSNLLWLMAALTLVPGILWALWLFLRPDPEETVVDEVSPDEVTPEPVRPDGVGPDGAKPRAAPLGDRPDQL
ncbi:MAG: MFS transporter [Candidatus Promineifilaceae bacterium]|nr:MFS transporter [Candidatus Promineifilaceae bacterium]